MKVIKFDDGPKNEVFAAAEKVLKKGGVIIGPSDTVYGIYGDATNPETIRKIFKIKKRVSEKAFPIFVKDIATARKFAYIDDRKARFLEKVWPGPVTVVFHHKEKLPGVLTGGKDTIGIRIPNHQFLLELLQRLDFPLVQTSANISGGEPMRSVEAAGGLGKESVVGLIIDGGELPKGPSTVVDFTRDNPIILRSGVITKKELDEILGV
ncbi:MAG: threonylcarbamoyl-AMP synthase [Candidatus Sungbacteria bacterium]|nr:threonylcarbamoyl-AMP synthase [Candidatus Sungbacteria bacterium]